MANKIKVLFHTIFYPMAIGRYFQRALQRREDVELKTFGSYTGAWIPWKGGMNVAQKYALPPDLVSPWQYHDPIADYDYVKAQLKGWKPDIIITVNAGSQWRSKPSEGLVVTIGTDAHCLDYTKSRAESDVFYNMHEVYSRKDDRILPYCYDPTVHYPDTESAKEYDVAMVGVEYQHRIELAQRLKAEGISVLFSNGEIFDEYRKSNCKAQIGLNWSSRNDLNARAFELPAMGLIPVMNRVSDMGSSRHGYFDNAYLFHCHNEIDDSRKSSFIDGAVEKVKMAMSNLEEAKYRTKVMQMNMTYETYDARVEQVLRECGFVN